MAVLTNFHRMNGPDGGREREHEADRGSEANYCSKGVPLLLLLLLHLQVLHSHLLSLHPNTHSANLYCPFLQLLLLQPLSALRLIPRPPRSSLRLLFLPLPPAAGGSQPPQLPGSKPPIFHPCLAPRTDQLRPLISYFDRCEKLARAPATICSTLCPCLKELG